MSQAYDPQTGETKMARCKFKAGDKVLFDGSVWVVVEWQPLNGIGGCYWIRNAKGENATAAVSELAAA